jgi:hypothetical protein
VPYTVTTLTTFTVNVADATAGAMIYYQWVFDYPPNDPNLTRALGGAQMMPAPPNGQPLQITSPRIGCTGISIPPGSGPNYLLALILAGAPFSDTQLGQFDDGSGMAPTYIWPLDMPCPVTP